jgi:hypothetical protein
VGFYFQFSPNISVTPHAAFGSDPFHTPFIISNNSYLKFSNVRTHCLLSNVKFIRGGGMTGGDFSSKDGEAHLIAPGESIAVSCVQESINIAPNEGLLSADIRIDVMFEVFPYGYRDEEKTFRFVAVKTDNGHWFWLPQPIGKP